MAASRYRHVSFDLDGTLVTTSRVYRDPLISNVVASLGGKLCDTAAIERFWYEGNRDALVREAFGVEPSAFWQRYHAADDAAKRALYTQAYDDAVPTLAALRTQRVCISVITGSPLEVAMMEVAKLGTAAPHFVFSITTSGLPSKPHPGSLLHVMCQLGVTARETLYVGNSTEDAAYAEAAGVDFCFIERKEYTFNFGRSGCRRITSLAELVETAVPLPQRIVRS